jgi:hypothetical protein
LRWLWAALAMACDLSGNQQTLMCLTLWLLYIWSAIDLAMLGLALTAVARYPWVQFALDVQDWEPQAMGWLWQARPKGMWQTLPPFNLWPQSLAIQPPNARALLQGNTFSSCHPWHQIWRAIGVHGQPWAPWPHLCCLVHMLHVLYHYPEIAKYLPRPAFEWEMPPVAPFYNYQTSTPPLPPAR